MRQPDSVDNIPFDKISHFEGGSEEHEAEGGRFSVFTGGLVEDATFSAGGFAVRYGRKNASVLDLNIKEGNTETMTVNGSFDLLGWEVNYDGPSLISNNTSLVLNARKFDMTTPLKVIGREDFGDPSLTDVIVKTTTFLSAGNKISFLGIYSDDNFDVG